ncbi:hypothetical protein APX70_03816, partial [Pseudomonas syringae pv. maculicola]
EPPLVSVGSQGLRPLPKTREVLAPVQPNSVVAVLPRIIAPAPLRRRMIGASCAGTASSAVNDPRVVRNPAVENRSLIPKGMPCKGPRGLPRCSSAVMVQACSSAASA